MKVQDKLRIFRSRFAGRQDVYGRQWTSRRNDGTEIKGFAPVCNNFWSDGCHIKLKDGVTCSQCEIQDHQPVNDDVVLKHIKGDEAQIHYLLLEDGRINFAALDFDYKPGREKFGYTFEDVYACSKVLAEWEFPHGIARSTGHGYHLYFFFTEPVQAHLFRAIMYELFERVGFLEQNRHGVRPLPEIFPKQANYGINGVGNGIKPPMIETRWPNERNGFVDGEDNFIPAEKQWEYLDGIARIEPGQIDALIEKESIPVPESPFSEATPTGSGNYDPAFGGRRQGKWQPPMIGSAEKMLEGCAALRKLRDKCLSGKQPGHEEGFALFHTLMATADGVQWFKDNVPGWAKNEEDWKQLEYSLNKNYAPYTCRKLQELQICAVGTKCFDPKPPVARVEGQTVIRKDVPKEQWPEPSPIRYALGSGDDFLLKLQEEARQLKGEENAKVKEEKLKNLARRAQVFDDDQQKAFKKYLKDELKLANQKDLSKYFNEAQEDHEKELVKNAEERDDIVTYAGDMYQKMNPYGYALIKEIRNKSKKMVLSQVDIWIEEERDYQDDGRTVSSVIAGRVLAKGVEKRFEIDASKWYDPTEFMKYFGVLLGRKLGIKRGNAEDMRQAATGFSEKRMNIEKTCYLCTQGWHKDRYLMPSVVVDKEGVRENTEQYVDLSRKEWAHPLDFKLLNDDEFRETMLHIKKDLLNTWPAQWTYTGLAHALMPALFKPLDIRKKPALFYEGLTGSGKTQLTHNLQYFWGDFHSILTLGNSTAKGILSAGYDFKDTLLVVDDYKGATYAEMKALQEAIQYSYDPTSSLKLRRDSSQQRAKGTRALLIFSGEEFLSADAAKVARTIIIETDKQDTSQTRETFQRCEEYRHNYRGITPRFLSWFLNQDLSTVKSHLIQTQNQLYEGIHGRQNADRLAFNLALNYTVWWLWCEFMVYSEVADPKERDEFLVQHWNHVIEIRDSMSERCENEQDATVFARVLKQLIDAKEVCIEGLAGHSPDRKEIIGWVPDFRDGSETAYIYPDLVFDIVKKRAKNFNLRGTDRSIGRQMCELGYVRRPSNGRRIAKQVRTSNGGRPYVWELDLVQMGIIKPKLQPVQQEIPYRPDDENVAQDSDGIY